MTPVRLRPGRWRIRGRPGLGQDGQDRLVLTADVIGFPRQPDPDAEREAGPRVEPREDVLER
jgi:hypothetical protein